MICKPGSLAAWQPGSQAASLEVNRQPSFA